MRRDVLVWIRPDTPNPVRLVVETAPGQQQNLNREQPGIQDDHLDKLRTGAPSAAIRDSVVMAVTDWFLGNDLRPTLTPCLASPVRLVINTDHKIESTFANVPFELTKWDAADYLVLKQNLTGLVYAPATSPTPQAPAAQSATFRVLLIRAEPNNYAGTVPSGVDLRNKLNAVVPAVPGLTVEVRLLSRETGADGAATWSSIQDEVTQRPPSAVLYLGHGDLLPGAGGPPSPVLLVERADGEQDELSAAGLRQLFRTQPVPLVALAGCLTAAAAPGVSNMRFGQSMAQFLVSGEGGVTVAIGMRYKIDIAAATQFLEELFRALFGNDTGNADLAVKAARNRLYMQLPNDLAWASPIVYRRVTSEPLFPELRTSTLGPAAATSTTPEDDAARAQLSVMWSQLAALPTDQPAVVDMVRQFSDTLDKALRKRLVDRGVVGLLPTIADLVAAPAARCKVVIQLTAPLEVRQLKLDLVLRGTTSCDVQPLAPALKALGVKRLFSDDDPGLATVEFRSDQLVTLPAGSLCEAEITVGAPAPSVVEVSVTGISCDPPRAVIGWVAAVVVRAN